MEIKGNWRRLKNLLIFFLFSGLFFFLSRWCLAQWEIEYPSPTAKLTSRPKWSDESGLTPARFKDLEVIFYNVVNMAAIAAGVATLVMIIVGGFGYLTAGGDAKKAEGAKNTLTYAVLGLVLLISGYIILRFIGEFTGLGDKLLRFAIPSE